MLKKILLILLGIGAGLLTVEGSLHLFDNLLPDRLRYRIGLAEFQAEMQDVFLADPYLWQKSAPGVNELVDGHPDYDYQVQTTSLGYANIGFRDDGPDGPSVAVALGDSFTWGDGVDNSETWVELLETDMGMDVTNLGVSGYGSLQRLRMLQRYGLPLKPKLVLWSFFPNDFHDDGHFAWRMETGRLARQDEHLSELSWLQRLDPPLRDLSLVYNWLMTPFDEPEDEEEWEHLIYKDRTLDLTFVLRPYWEKRLDPHDEYVGRGVDLTRQALSQAQAAAVHTNANLVVIIFPFKEQVYWPIVSTLIDDPTAYDVNWPAQEVKSWCQAQGIAYLDLTPIFIEHAAKGEQLYFRYDAHWNEAGHALAAQAIQAYLAKQKAGFARFKPSTVYRQ